MNRKALLAQAGFTIIEVISVLVVLIILAINALPSFVDTSNEALQNQRDTVVAAFRGTVKTVQLKWIMDGRTPATSNNRGAEVQLNPGTIVTVDDNYGFPVGSAGADRVGSMSLADCESVFNDLVEHSFSTALRGQVNNETLKTVDIVITRENGAPDLCHYTWTQSIETRPRNRAPEDGVGFSYNPATGSVTTFDFG